MYATIQVTEAMNDHEIQTERPEIQLENLLAEIGGVMGLWVGISVITLMEFVEIIVFSMYFLRSSWKWLSKLPQNVFTAENVVDNRNCESRQTFSTPVKLCNESTEMTTFVNNYIQDSLARCSNDGRSPNQANKLFMPSYRGTIPAFEIEHHY